MYMSNESELNGRRFGGVTMLPEMAFDLTPDKPLPSLGKTQAPVNQLPELAWDCSKLTQNTAGRVWGIKLGSGGCCIPFCERHGIIGVGWETVDPNILISATREQLWSHVKQVCTSWYQDDRQVGKATGQLHRFGQECKEGDYVLYYDPPKKQVRICRVVSGARYRDFDLAQKELAEKIDIWHYRKVEYPIDPIPVLDFYGSLKGRLLGPRMSFWNMGPVFDMVDQMCRGQSPNQVGAPDPEVQSAYERLQDVVNRRLEILNDSDWELLVADYFKSQGAYVDESRVGGNQAVIDVEAYFDRGELGPDLWRVQVKRYQDCPVDWPEIEDGFRHAGDAHFCFVSVYGFTEDARMRAEKEENLTILKREDFGQFLLSGRLRPELRQKLRLPIWAP